MIGRTVAHYRILERLGAGGMGVVYRARDLKLDRDVVLKFLSPSPRADDEAKRRLIQEAKAASALDHPNICTIYDLDASEDGQAFISMAYYEGEALYSRIARGPLPIALVIDITRQVASGLAAAHARGIVHRDIKPGNIFITADGVVKLLDFGVAKFAGGSRITRTGMTLGTAAYMSPEQTRGEEVDRRADVWSLGVVLHEMVTGERPFRGDRTGSVVHSILTIDPPPLASVRAGVPEGLQRIVSRALAKDAARRCADMNEVLADLRSCETTAPAARHVVGATSAQVSPPRRRVVLAAASAVLVLGVVGGALLWRSQRSSGPGPSDAPRAGSAGALKRLAVMPFTNRGSHPATDYIGYALADRIIDRLSYFKGIVVRSSSAVREYQNRTVDAVTAGSQLKVDYVLTGSVWSDEQTVRLSFELVNVESGRRILEEPVEVRYKDAFRMQNIVADKVLRVLELDLPPERSRTPTDVPRSPLAYQHYLRSLSYPETEEGTRLALGLLEESIALDASYAPAHAELGIRRRWLAIYGLGGKAAAARAEETFRKALELNPELLAARCGLARLYTETGQPEKAVGMLRDVLKTNPDHADSHFSVSYVYRYAGMLRESAREGERALILDPNNPRYRSLATTYLYLGDHDRALEVHKLDPDSPWTLARVGQIHLRRGQTKLALELFNRTIDREPESSTGRWAVAMRSYLRGEPEVGLAVLRRNEQSGMVDGEQWYHMANVHSLLGDREGCLRALKAAVDGGFFNYPFMQRDSFLDPMRHEPRFQRILAEAKAKHEAFRAQVFPEGAPANAPRSVGTMKSSPVPR